MVALIAERHLAAAAAATVNRLLAMDRATSMADVANWADDWRLTHPNTGAWHFVDIPVDAPGYDPNRDCQHRACVVAKINGYTRILGNDSRSDADREEALKFLIHFVADVHQPLHSADRHDRGGNDVRVVYAGRATNLHHIWDVDLVDAAKGAETEAAFVERLDQPGAQAQGTPAADPAAWADQAHGLAVAVAYAALPADMEIDLSGDYAARAMPVVDQQLERAGLRLAAVLNATFP
jgi:hypothetical protein